MSRYQRAEWLKYAVGRRSLPPPKYDARISVRSFLALVTVCGMLLALLGTVADSRGYAERLSKNLNSVLSSAESSLRRTFRDDEGDLSGRQRDGHIAD